MKILQGGVPKCGNFWLYKIIQQILIRSGRSNSSFIEHHPVYNLAKHWELNYPEQARIDVLEVTDLQNAYRISSIFKMPIEDLEGYVNETTHVWTHSPICKRSKDVFRLFDKKVYIIRDPRDRILSAAKYYCSPYMLKYFPQPEKDPKDFLEKNLDGLMVEWVWHVYDHLRYSKAFGIQIVFFENFLLDFCNELNSLLDYLEIDLGEEEKFKLEEAVSFKNLKSQNPKHLNKGAAGYWMDALTHKQMLRARKIAAPLLNLLSYPERIGQVYQKISLPNTIDFESLRMELINLHQEKG